MGVIVHPFSTIYDQPSTSLNRFLAPSEVNSGKMYVNYVLTAHTRRHVIINRVIVRYLFQTTRWMTLSKTMTSYLITKTLINYQNK